MLQRIAVAARNAHDHRDAWKAELALRNQAIVEAMDSHLAPERIAGAAKLDVSRIHRIVAEYG